MTITISLTNPAEHQPSELRALALFLNQLAEDRETGRIAYQAAYVQAPSGAAIARHDVPAAPAVEVAAAPVPLPPTPETAPAAPSASAPLTVPLAPAADVPPAPPTLSGVDVDKTGLPWDGRIHSETKNKLQDGTWRKKRGVEPALVTEVEARLRELAAIPAAPAAEAAPEVPPAPPAPVTMPPVVETPPAPPAVVAPPAPAAPAAENTPAAAATVADVFKFVSAAEKAGTLTPDARLAALAELGFNNMVEISTRPDLAGQIIAKLKEYGA